MHTLYDYGYAIWCQRSNCYRCKDNRCECPHHKGDGVADPDIVQVCLENAVQRGSLAFKCQMGQHGTCKKSRCNCRCHVSGEATVPQPIIKADVPVASEENVLELQERIFAAEASWFDFEDKIALTTGVAVASLHDAKTAIGVSIKEFDQRLATMEASKKVTIVTPGKKANIDVGIVHRSFKEVVDWLTIGLIPYVVGSAGGGKSEGMRLATKAIGLDPETHFFPQIFGAQTTQSSIIGYRDANGNPVHSPACRACTIGGVWFADEVDAANAGVMTSANTILSQEYILFGCCGMVKRHANTRFAVAANTFGKGADHLYVGRNQLDAATLNRFVWINWDYDWELTRAFAGDRDGFTTHVEHLSECVAELKLRVVIGPRQALFGNKALEAGMEREYVEQRVIWAPIDLDDRRKIEAAMDRKYPRMVTCPNCGVEHRLVDAHECVKDHICSVCLNSYYGNDFETHACNTPTPPPEIEGLAEPSETDSTSGVIPTNCKRCQSLMQARIGAGEINVIRRNAGVKPVPLALCSRNPACKFKVWPVNYDWGTGTWK